LPLRRTAFFCALAFCSVVSSPTLAPAAAAPARCTRLVLTAHPDYPPVAWAHGGTLRGAGIEVVRQLAKDADVPLVITDEGSWAAAQSAVKSGKADAIVGLYRTPKRMEFFDYVQPAIAPDPSAVLARVGEPFSYTGWNSLIGKKGAASHGEAYGDTFDAFMKARLTIQRVSGFSGVYQAVADKSADYGLIGYYAAVTGAPKSIRIVEPNFVTEGLFIAFGKHSACEARLTPTFSKDVKRMIADGTVKRLFAAALAQYKASH